MKKCDRPHNLPVQMSTRHSLKTGLISQVSGVKCALKTNENAPTESGLKSQDSPEGPLGPKARRKEEDDIWKHGHALWLKHYAFKEIDRDVEQFLNATARFDWLRAARRSLFLSKDWVAARMGVDQAQYRRLEEAERSGKLTLELLKRAAEAMGCELVYAIRPRARVSFSNKIWLQLQPYVELMVQRFGTLPPAATIAKLARKLRRDREFCIKVGWSRKQEAASPDMTY